MACHAALEFASHGVGAGNSSVTNSGQIRCQVSGRKSRRETHPSVAFSIAAHRSVGIGRMPFLHWLISTGETSRTEASFAALPGSWR